MPGGGSGRRGPAGALHADRPARVEAAAVPPPESSRDQKKPPGVGGLFADQKRIRPERVYFPNAPGKRSW